MFANPLWSVLILLALAGMYAIIRYRHGGPLLDTSHTWPQWFISFRSWVATAAATLAIALPDILSSLVGIDFSWLIGADYAKFVAGLLTTFLAINTAFKTKPDGVKAA